MANLISTIVTAGLQGDNVRTYSDVLRADSALIAATGGGGGQILPNVDFRDHKIIVVQDDALPTEVAEGTAKPAADAVVTPKPLEVKTWAKWRGISRQLDATQDPASLAADIVNSAVPAFPIAYDVKHLGLIAVGAGVGSVEYDAADPITSLSALFAPYDSTSYMADGMVLTRAGARKLGFAVDANGRLQAPGGLAGLANVPTYVTGATGAQLGVATVMAIVGPWGAGSVGIANGVTVERMPQATVGANGPANNIVNYLIEGAMGYVNAIDGAAPTGVGFTILIDAV